VKFPAQWKGGTVADGVAQHVDILPTILRALGIDAPAGLTGQSLLPAVACPGAARATPAYSYIADPETESVVVGDRKLIHYLQPDSPHRRFELYDRSTDAEERRDLAARHPVEVGYLSTVMAAFTNSRPTAAAVPTHVLDASTQERLRALGYAH
jgi:arylsulfatase A-like enzyme